MKQKERRILKNIPKEYKYISRCNDNLLLAHKENNNNDLDSYMIHTNLFKFIEYNKYYLIDDLKYYF